MQFLRPEGRGGDSGFGEEGAAWWEGWSLEFSVIFLGKRDLSRGSGTGFVTCKGLGFMEFRAKKSNLDRAGDGKVDFSRVSFLFSQLLLYWRLSSY